MILATIRTSARASSLAVLTSLTLILPQAASAAGATDLLQTFKPYAGAEVAYDSNLFRLSKDSAVSALYGETAPSDIFYTIGAGFDGGFDVSKQNFVLKGNIFRRVYDDFSDLDYTGGTADAIWNWQAGEQWEGDLGYSYERDLQGFENQTVRRNNAADPALCDPLGGIFVCFKDKDIRTRQNVKAKANYWVTRDWRVFVRGRYTDVSFKEKEQLDVERSTVGFGADYITRIGNRIGVDADFTTGRYNETPAVGAAQPDYDEYNFGPTANWEVSEKTRVRGRIRYTNRDYDSGAQEDFDGITWRLTLVRNPKEDNNLEASLYREISTLNDDISNYAVVDGVSIAPVWQIGGKTTLKLLGQYEIRNFKGSEILSGGGIPTASRRKDKVATVEATLNWEATRAIDLELAYRFEDRASDRKQGDIFDRIEEYDYNLLQLRVKAGF